MLQGEDKFLPVQLDFGWLKQKTDLKLKNSDFSNDSKSWVEPLRNWVQTLDYAGKLTSSVVNLSEIKAFAEKVGSNRLLQDKKIVFAWLPPYELLAEHKGLAAQTTKSSDKAELKKGGEKQELLSWWTRRDSNSRPNKE